MTREEKNQTINHLKEKFQNHDFFYLADSSTLTVAQVNNLRRNCFEKGIEMNVVKNTLAKKALELLDKEKGYDAVFDYLKGPTSIFFTETANLPARVIKEFRKKHDKPMLKVAYIDSDVYTGDDKIQTLCDLKSKEELVGDIIALLQSPIKNVLGSLQSGAHTISGLLKALEDRNPS